MSTDAATTGTPAPGAGTTGETTETVSATRAAADAGDVTSFLDADRDARSGKPRERVTRAKSDPTKPAASVPGRPNAKPEAAAAKPPVAGKDGQPAAGPTDKDRDADARLTARIREAVDTSTADLRRQNEDLRRQVETLTRTPASGPAKPAEAPKKETPADAYKRYAAMPDAPKIEDFDTLAEFNGAMSLFISDVRATEQSTATREASTKAERTRSDLERATAFSGRIETFRKEQPDFGTKLSADVRGLHGWAKLQEINAQREASGQPPIPATVDHAIAECLYDADDPGRVALYLSTNPNELQTLRQAKSPDQLMKAFARLEDKVAATKPSSTGSGAPTEVPPTTTTTVTKPAEQAAAVIDRSVSSNAPPPQTFGRPGANTSDPIAKALESGDVGMFLELDRQARAQKAGLSARA